VKSYQEPADHLVNLVEDAELYHHLVNDHGWPARPYLLDQRLHHRHRLEHKETALGRVSLAHSHEVSAPAVQVIALPLAGHGRAHSNGELGDELADDVAQVA
jgi:hypothetical protein